MSDSITFPLSQLARALGTVPLLQDEEGVQPRPDQLRHYTLIPIMVFLAVGMVLEDCLEELFDISFSGAELCLSTSYYLKFCDCLVIRVGPSGPT
jgi:hypothetical protein